MKTVIAIFAMVLLLVVSACAEASKWVDLDFYVKTCQLIVLCETEIVDGKPIFKVTEEWKGKFKSEDFGDRLQARIPKPGYLPAGWGLHSGREPHDGQKVVFFFLPKNGGYSSPSTSFDVRDGKLIYAEGGNPGQPKEYTLEGFKKAILEIVESQKEKIEQQEDERKDPQAAIKELDENSSFLKSVEHYAVLPGQQSPFKELKDGGDITCPAGYRALIYAKTLPRARSVQVAFEDGAIAEASLSCTGATTAFSRKFIVTKGTAYELLLTDKDGTSKTFGPYEVHLAKGSASIDFSMGDPHQGLSIGVAANPHNDELLLVRFLNEGDEPLSVYWHRSYDCPITVEATVDGKPGVFRHKSFGFIKDLEPDDTFMLLPGGEFCQEIRLSDFIGDKHVTKLRLVYESDKHMAPQEKGKPDNAFRGKCRSGEIQLDAKPKVPVER